MGVRNLGLVAGVTAALLLASCGGTSDEAASPARTDAPASGVSIEIVSPHDGETVLPLFELEVDVSGVELELGPNEALVPGKAHWHATIDGAGLPYAYDDEAGRIGPFSPGAHTLDVALYVNDADAVEVASDAIDIIVAEPPVPTQR
ncbi:MAG: hypothetical protein WEB04_12285 [Dehalococcoidia bacterium]